MYNDHRGFVDSQDNQKDFNEKYLNKDSGPFLGTVKVTEDPKHTRASAYHQAAPHHTTSLSRGSVATDHCCAALPPAC